MNERYTSRVFQAGIKVYDLLAAAEFPTHDTTGGTIPVEFGDEDPDAGAEKICVVLDVEGTENAWVRLGPGGRDEPMLFTITFRSLVPGMESTRAMWDRLGEVTGAIEDVFFNRETRRPIALGFDGEVPIGRVSGVKPTVWPTPEGWNGSVLISLSLLASI